MVHWTENLLFLERHISSIKVKSTSTSTLSMLMPLRWMGVQMECMNLWYHYIPQTLSQTKALVAVPRKNMVPWEESLQSPVDLFLLFYKVNEFLTGCASKREQIGWDNFQDMEHPPRLDTKTGTKGERNIHVRWKGYPEKSTPISFAFASSDNPVKPMLPETWAQKNGHSAWKTHALPLACWSQQNPHQKHFWGRHQHIAETQLYLCYVTPAQLFLRT